MEGDKDRESLWCHLTASAFVTEWLLRSSFGLVISELWLISCSLWSVMLTCITESLSLKFVFLLVSLHVTYSLCIKGFMGPWLWWHLIIPSLNRAPGFWILLFHTVLCRNRIAASFCSTHLPPTLCHGSHSLRLIVPFSSLQKALQTHKITSQQLCTQEFLVLSA